MSSRVRVWGDASTNEPVHLIPGQDLVLHAPSAGADQLAEGVLLDDWLTLDLREDLDRTARGLMAAWQRRRGPDLTIAGVPLAYVHELELYADVFLRETRIVLGLSSALVRGGAAACELRNVDAELARCLDATLPVAVEAREPAPPPFYPIAFAGTARAGRTMLGKGRAVTGIPGWPRGRVLVEPYWHLAPVCRRLAVSRAFPVVNPLNLPALGRRELVDTIRVGGWLGDPGVRARARARRVTAGALAMLVESVADDPLDELLDRRCSRLLATRAQDTVALVDARRRAFSRATRAFLTYSDTAPVPRLTIVAAREHGAKVVHVQHGLFGHLPRDDGAPARVLDGWSADVVAVWSEHEHAVFAPSVPGRVEVTGNPGAEHLTDAPHTRPSEGHVLVLGQMRGPLSTVWDARVSSRHLRAALMAAARTGHRTVVVRPHPLDRDLAAQVRLAEEFPTLDVRLESAGPVEAAIAGAGLCVGAVSTATLQAAALGTPTVLLDVTNVSLEWPFDGSSDFPTAGGTDDLADLIATIGRAGETGGRETALAALGARRGASEAVLRLIAEDGD